MRRLNGVRSRRNGARPLSGAFLALVAALVCAVPASAQDPIECELVISCPSIAVGDQTVTEGDSGTTTASFTVTRSGDTSGVSTVQYATEDGTATAGSDYSETTGLVTFAAGDATETITVDVNGDDAVEPDETFNVNLSGQTGATVSDAEGAGTITDEDTPMLTVSDASTPEGGSGSANTATFGFTRTGNVDAAASFSYATEDGSATAGSDYTATSGEHAFAAGETTTEIDVPVSGDGEIEPDETFTMTISEPVGTAIDDGEGTGTITNDDTGLAISDVSVTEGDTGTATATFTVTRSGDTSGSASVDYATADGTAVAGGDYDAASGTVTFAAGETTKTVDVSVNGDTAVEPDESFTVDLSAATGATISDAQGVGTITNDDIVPSLAVSDATTGEGDSGTLNASFTVTRSGNTTVASSVNYATADGTALAGSDYESRSDTLTFAAGETTKTVNVPVTGDTAVEGDETFTVNLSAASGATITDAQGVGTITNDDIVPSIAVSNVTTGEGNSGTTAATFTVTRSGNTTVPSSVDYDTEDGSATAGSDYESRSDTLEFASGETSKTVGVPVMGDGAVESDETFVLMLSNEVGATLDKKSATGTITNDDVPTPPKQEPAGPDPVVVPPLDKIAPGVSKLSLSNRKFRVGKSATIVAARAKVGTAFRYSLTEAATMTIIIDSAKLGKTVRKKCVAPTRKNRRAKRCTRYSFIGAITRRSVTGLNNVPFTGRIGSKALKPGNYRARVIATDGSNNRSPIKATSFTVVKK